MRDQTVDANGGDNTATTHSLRACLERRLRAHRLDSHVDAASASERHDLGDRVFFLRVDHHIRTEPLRHLEALRKGIDCDDEAAATRAGTGRCAQSDRSLGEDRHRRSEACLASLYRPETSREDVGPEDRHLVADAIRYFGGIDVRERDLVVLCLAAEEDSAPARADAVVYCHTFAAFPAADKAGSHDAIAFTEPGDTFTDRVDGTHAFMAHEQALRQNASNEEGAEHLVRKFIEEMHVRAADRRHRSLYDHLAGARLGCGDVNDFDLAVGGFDAGAHCYLRFLAEGEIGPLYEHSRVRAVKSRQTPRR